MTRAPLVLTALAVLALLAAATPASAAAARQPALKVPLPSAGDITVAHIVFKRSVAHSRRLPDLRLVSASTRRVLRRYGVAVVGGSFRLTRRQVVGSVVLMRARGKRRAARTPRTAAARIAADAPVASAIVERNAIADLRRERARASGEIANAPTVTGETGLFTLLSGDTLPQGGWSFSLYYNNWDRLVDFSDAAVEGDDDAESLMFHRLSVALGYGITDRWDPSVLVSYDEFLNDLGAVPPGPSLFILTTYIGPAVDSQGNVLTQPSLSTTIRSDTLITGLTLTIPGHVPTFCQDSAGHDCVIQGGTAQFPFLVPPLETRYYNLVTDPPLERGDQVQIEGETPRGDFSHLDVM
jgi:hypothetical protein